MPSKATTAANLNYFAATASAGSPPLHALANGVYAYGSTSNFPTEAWNISNYWADVMFQL